MNLAPVLHVYDHDPCVCDTGHHRATAPGQMMQSILPILLLGASALAQEAPGAATAPVDSPAVVVQSQAATSPQSLALPQPIAALGGDLNRLIDSPGRPADRWRVMGVARDRGDTIFAHQPDLALAPASNMKLFTTAAALYYLGPNFRYGTYLLSDGPVRNGVLQGDLVVYGTGDPTLSDRFFNSKTAVWEAFADSLAALGVREIQGDVVGDASYFDDDGVGLGWQHSYMNAAYAAPVGALSFNENIVTLRITPGEQPGWRPTILKVPGGEGISIVNLATTVAGGRTWIAVDRAAYDGPIVVRGNIAAGGSPVWRAVPVADPARYAAAVLREVLERRGIVVRGGIRAVHDRANSPVTGRTTFAPAFDEGAAVYVLAAHQSPTMQEILSVVNKKSHNLYAEAVLRTVGRVALGDGSAHGGARAVTNLLATEFDTTALALQMYDGSGLSVLNRVSARTMTDLLAFMARSPVWASYWATLPEAGDPGGLRRMHQTQAAGNLRAKTGTINYVSALSGYVRAANGERLAFSIISNNVPSTWRAKRVEDAIGIRLARFDRPFPGAGASTPAPGAVSTLTPGATTAPDSAAPVSPVVAWPSEPAIPGQRNSHVIRQGDTLERIAKEYGTTVRALREANPGVNPRRLLPGMRLRLP